MKRILIQAGRHPFDRMSAESTLLKNSIRGNVGNLMYTNAAFRHLSAEGVELTADTTHFRDLTLADADRINESCDVLVIPMANAFKKKFVPHLRLLAQVVRRLKVPVVVFGVGAQASLRQDTAELAHLDDAVRDFVGAVLDRSSSIGVRGTFTQHYLNHLGFTDVDVIGCPSVYFNGPDFRMEGLPEKLPEAPRIALSTALRIHDVERAAEFNRSVLRQFPDLTYFAQEVRDLRMLFWGDTAAAAGTTAPMPDHGTHPLAAEADICVPLEPHSWIRALSEYDFAVGTRIHGNVAALAAGVPNFVVAHDSRTTELAEYHGIPYRRITELDPEIDLRNLYAEADFGEFNRKYADGFQRMLGFLERNGLQNTYEHGDSGRAYDRAAAAVDFPAPYRRQRQWDQDDLEFRVASLQEEILGLHSTVKREGNERNRLRSEVGQLRSEIGRLQKRLDKLESAQAKTDKIARAAALPLRTRVNRALRRRAKRLIGR